MYQLPLVMNDGMEWNRIYISTLSTTTTTTTTTKALLRQSGLVGRCCFYYYTTLLFLKNFNIYRLQTQTRNAQPPTKTIVSNHTCPIFKLGPTQKWKCSQTYSLQSQETVTTKYCIHAYLYKRSQYWVLQRQLHKRYDNSEGLSVCIKDLLWLHFLR